MRGLCAVALLVALAGCATLFTPSKDKISFSSDLDEVTVYIDGQLVGRTPLEVEIPRAMATRGALARFVKDGYEPQEFRLKRRFNKVAIWNSTGIFSWGTDILSGAWYEYEPLKYHIELASADRAAMSSDFLKRRDYVRFVMLNFHRLWKDLARGEGPYLTSLAGILDANRGRIDEILNVFATQRDEYLAAPSRANWIRHIDRLETAS